MDVVRIASRTFQAQIPGQSPLTITDRITHEVLYTGTISNGWSYEFEDADGAYIWDYDGHIIHIYDFEDMWSCLEKMYDYIFCYDDTECCDPQTPEDKKIYDLYKIEINKIQLLYWKLFYALNITAFKSIEDHGINNDDQIGSDTSITDTYEKLMAIVDRCGCTDADNEINTDCI